MAKGANIVTYSSLSDAFKIMKNSEAELNFLYIDILDIIQHRYGVNSNETRDTVRKIFGEIGKLKNKDATTIISADHGQIDVGKYFIMPIEEKYVGGSPRDVFVYAENTQILDNALTLKKSEILKLLGLGKEHPKLNKRMPNYIILPEDNLGFWFEKMSLKGLHGGLSKEEMLVPFIIIEC